MASIILASITLGATLMDWYRDWKHTESFYTTKDKLNSVPEYILSVKV